MKKSHLFILGFSYACLSILCCGTKQHLTNQDLTLVNYVVIDSLVCRELSENLRGLASGDDEILALYYLIGQSKTLFADHKGITSFSKEKSIEKIGQRIPLVKTERNIQFVILILEQDSYLNAEELSSIVDANISFAHLPRIDKVALQTKLGDDDLLDAKVIQLHKVDPSKTIKTKLSGVHLFDKYEYWLYWHLE